MINRIKKLLNDINIKNEANADNDLRNRLDGKKLVDNIVNYLRHNNQVLPFYERGRLAGFSLDVGLVDSYFDEYRFELQIIIFDNIKTSNIVGSFIIGDYNSFPYTIKIGIPDYLAHCYNLKEYTTEALKFISDNSLEFTDTLVHEFIHFINRIKNKHVDTNHKGYPSYTKYLSNPSEFDSYAQGIMASLDDKPLRLDNFKNFLQDCTDTSIFLTNYLLHSDDNYKKKMKLRLYQYYINTI